MEKVTAVEWAMSQIIKGHFIGFAEEFQAIYDKAKTMEKEQMQQQIEIPTDEDIEKKIESLKGWVLIEKDFFERGANWMRNQIINKNK